MTNNFYRAFEDKHRGSRDLISSRLKVYLPFIRPLLTLHPAGKALDLGCGRGEWLEIVSEQGFDAQGVDLDEGMLQACLERGLNVALADALLYMQSLPNECMCIVSGFHIAEHLPFGQLQQLVLEAKRILLPAGLLILETPNPENLSVATSSFYLDPTHERPIPPGLLSFLPEYYGFSRVKVIRLQEDKSLIDKRDVSLQDVISGASPDYAVVAQKSGTEAEISLIDEAFSHEYGISLGVLTGALDRRLTQIESLSIQAEAKAQQAEDVARQLHAQLAAMLTSRSWKITKPLRWASDQARRMREEGFRARSNAFIGKVFRKINHELMLRPALRNCLLKVIRSIGLHGSLKALFRKLLGPQGGSFIDVHTSFQSVYLVKNLPPKAQQCFVDLQQAMKRQKKGDL